MTVKLTPQFVDQVARMYEWGLSPSRISRKLHVGYRVVLEAIRRSGVRLRVPGQSAGAPTEEEIAERCLEVQQTWTEEDRSRRSSCDSPGVELQVIKDPRPDHSMGVNQRCRT